MSYEMYRQQFEGESFNDIIVDQLHRAPWLLISAFLHLLVIGIIWMFASKEETNVELDNLQTELDQDIEEEDPEEELEEPEEEPEEVEQVEDDVVEDTEVDDHDEDDTNEEYEETTGDEDNLSDKPFDGTGTNDAIGLGGGAGGAFGGRRGGRRRARKGRGRKAQRAVDFGLEWLARHQSPDGSWDSDGFNCDPETGECKGAGVCLENSKGGALYDVGNTGLALLAFLGAGETHRVGQYKKTVRRGLRWLMEQQDPEGCIGPRTAKQFTYNHAIGAFALAEAYALTKSPLFKEKAQKAVDFCIAAQNPYKAWRYSVRPGQNDTSVTGWMVMALKSAKQGGLHVDPQSLKWALDFIDQMTSEETGRTGYMKRGEPPVRAQGRLDQFPYTETESLTAVGVCTRIFAGSNPAEDPKIKLGVQLMEKKLPVWDTAKGSIDMYYWYYGSLAMYQAQGSAWNSWNAAMNKAIVETQHQDGPLKGSWDPVGAWGEDGGRIYSTSLMTLCLEVFYRYGKTLGTR